jgi:hypothetical protein
MKRGLVIFLVLLVSMQMVLSQDLSCSERTGIICDLGEECSGDSVFAADTPECCLGSCLEISNDLDVDENQIKQDVEGMGNLGDIRSSDTIFQTLPYLEKFIVFKNNSGIYLFFIIILISIIIGWMIGKRKSKKQQPVQTQPQVQTK